MSAEKLFVKCGNTMASKNNYTIQLPEKTEARIAGGEIFVKGPKGELHIAVHPSVAVVIENGAVSIMKAHEETPKAMLGLVRALITNLVKGVNEEFVKKLEIEGVGYRVALNGTKLVMQLGFSHPVEFEAPQGITFVVEKNVITISGIDKALVGQTAANIRKLKKPEPYKGKGIRYQGEVVRRKEGKRAGTAA